MTQLYKCGGASSCPVWDSYSTGLQNGINRTGFSLFGATHTTFLLVTLQGTTSFGGSSKYTAELLNPRTFCFKVLGRVRNLHFFKEQILENPRKELHRGIDPASPPPSWIRAEAGDFTCTYKHEFFPFPVTLHSKYHQVLQLIITWNMSVCFY